MDGKPQVTALRSGFTTGACACAAAKAAAIMLATGESVQKVMITLPEGGGATLPVEKVERVGDGAKAIVIKDAGDDPDITNGATIVVEITPAEGDEIVFEAGEGVGIVSKAGLSIPAGEPAINPVPRRMISESIREALGVSVRVRISIPGGEKLASKTFNPRLGVVGGLSILGTTGIVRPFSCQAVKQSIVCLLNVALANGADRVVFTPGAIGARAASQIFGINHEQIVEISNEWGYMLDIITGKEVKKIVAIGHPGKLAKLAAGHWDTHSKRSPTAAPYVIQMAEQIFSRAMPESETVEGVFGALDRGEMEILGNSLAKKISEAIEKKVGGRLEVAVALVNMKSRLIGIYGKMDEWNKN
ncbi:Cobalt-precorrin-5B (C1)-methyltransferase [hydrothermal vent metagenome]|uniref:Cobalt-precorrin-5B (C1)-methyltransferase n=1 Tax=hydrothermal vent metagenome TaxID=652676 RepID=A0A3B1D2J5_9ZZZZ